MLSLLVTQPTSYAAGPEYTRSTQGFSFYFILWKVLEISLIWVQYFIVNICCFISCIRQAVWCHSSEWPSFFRAKSSDQLWQITLCLVHLSATRKYIHFKWFQKRLWELSWYNIQHSFSNHDWDTSITTVYELCFVPCVIRASIPQGLFTLLLPADGIFPSTLIRYF
jgi:hypothetical protein